MITATFAADFSQFSGEVKKAEGDLKELEGQTAETGAAIATMGNMSDMTGGDVLSLRESFRQFDDALASVGIRIGPAIKGIEDIAAAAGKSIVQVGLLGTVGLILAAAMAGWKIGRTVAEFFDLDNIIAKNASTLMGWGDVAAEEAGAGADVLRLASERAGRQITDMSEALRINQKWVDDHKKAATENAKALDEWKKANQEVTIAAQDHAKVLQTINGTTVEAAKYALDHGVSLKNVATAYGLTASQIAAVQAALKAEQEAAKESEKEHARITAAIKRHWDGVLEIRDEVLGVGAIEKLVQWREAIHALGGNIQTLSKSQLKELEASMAAAKEAIERSAKSTEYQSQEFLDLVASAQQALTVLDPLVNTWERLAQAEYEAALAADASAQAMGRAHDEAKAMQETMNSWGTHEAAFAGFPTSAELDKLSHAPGSMLGFGLGPSQSTMAMNPLTGKLEWTPIHAGGGAPIVNLQPGAVTMNYPIMDDPYAMDQIGRLVGDAMMSRITRPGTRV
jgi:hypothetical protein